MPYPFHDAAADEGGGYLIEFSDLPGCMSDGAAIEAAVTNGLDAMRGLDPGDARRGPSDPRTDRSAAA